MVLPRIHSDMVLFPAAWLFVRRMDVIGKRQLLSGEQLLTVDDFTASHSPVPLPPCQENMKKALAVFKGLTARMTELAKKNQHLRLERNVAPFWLGVCACVDSPKMSHFQRRRSDRTISDGNPEKPRGRDKPKSYSLTFR